MGRGLDRRIFLNIAIRKVTVLSVMSRLNAVNNSPVIYNHLCYFISIVFDNTETAQYKSYFTVLQQQQYSSLHTTKVGGPFPRCL